MTDAGSEFQTDGAAQKNVTSSQVTPGIGYHILVDLPSQPGRPSAGRCSEYWRWFRPPTGEETVSSA